METITSPEIQNLPTITPQNNNYKILFFVSLGLLLIIGSVLATLLITQKSSNPTQTKPTGTEETELIPTQSVTSEVTGTEITPTTSESKIPSDWKTYSSKELGLSFKYPESWGELKSEVIDYTTKSGPFSGKLVYINFQNPSTKVRVFIDGLSKDYKTYMDVDSYTGGQNNLDSPEIFNQQKGDIYFTKKMTVANQKTTIKTSLVYIPEASGVLIKSSTKINGKNEYTGINIAVIYSNFNKILDQYYDAVENKGLESAAIKILTGLKDGTSQDKEMENLYKDYQTFLSTIKFN